MALLWTHFYRSMSLSCWEQTWGAILLVGSHENWMARITFLCLLATLLWIQPRTELSFWAVTAHSQITFNFSSTNSPKSFSLELLVILSLPSLDLCLEFPQLGWSTLHLALLNFMKFTPTSQACQGSSGWHSFPPVCQPHHTVWCH